MSSQIDVYIGSNNKTHKIELSKTLGIINKYFANYSVTKLVGYYKGGKENSIKVTFINDSELSTELMASYSVMVSELKKELEQESILVVVTLLNKVKFV